MYKRQIWITTAITPGYLKRKRAFPLPLTGKVFNGNTYFLEGLKNPFSIFSGITEQSSEVPDRYNRSVIFPVPIDDDKITHGVIVFMP